MNPLTSIPGYFIDKILKSAATSVAEFTVNKYSEMRFANAYEENAEMERRQLLCVSFNQDASSLAVGHEEGYTLYSLRSIDNLEKAHDGKTPQKTCVIERLFSSSLITLVSLQHARKLQVYHFQKENEICSHNYAGSILSVRLNRKRVVVCLEESIHVHNIRDMRLLHTIRDTPPNQIGLFDLSPGDEACYLAYPGSATTGHVHIFDAEGLQAVSTIAAHDAPLAAVKFNSDGSKLATASTKGTVIRVFGVPNGERLFEFTRGVARCVTIHSLAFSVDSKFLCSSSNTETVHVFSLVKREEHQQRPDENDQSLSSWVNYFSSQAQAYLPTQMNDLMLREKSFAYARLPMVGTKTIVAMPRIGNRDYLVVASSDGFLFCYTVEPEGGECTLMRQYRIGPLTQDEIQQQQQTASGQVIIASSACPPTQNEQGQKIYPNLNKESEPASTQPKMATPPLMVPVAVGSARQISTSPPSLVSAALSSSPGAATIKPQIRKISTPVKATVKASSPAAAPARTSPRRDSDSDRSTGDLAPLGDLNDLDEFPPLSHATS